MRTLSILNTVLIMIGAIALIYVMVSIAQFRVHLDPIEPAPGEKWQHEMVVVTPTPPSTCYTDGNRVEHQPFQRAIPAGNDGVTPVPCPTHVPQGLVLHTPTPPYCGENAQGTPEPCPTPTPMNLIYFTPTPRSAVPPTHVHIVQVVPTPIDGIVPTPYPCFDESGVNQDGIPCPTPTPQLVMNIPATINPSWPTPTPQHVMNIPATRNPSWPTPTPNYVINIPATNTPQEVINIPATKPDGTPIPHEVINIPATPHAGFPTARPQHVIQLTPTVGPPVCSPQNHDLDPNTPDEPVCPMPASTCRWYDHDGNTATAAVWLCPEPPAQVVIEVTPTPTPAP